MSNKQTDSKILRPCPECGTELDGGPIPEKIRENYAPPYRWKREIYNKVYQEDGTKKRFYTCPDCKKTIIPPK